MFNLSQSSSTDVVPGEIDRGLSQAHSSLRVKLTSMMEFGKPMTVRSRTPATAVRSRSACKGTPQMPQASGQLSEPTNMGKGVLIPVAVDVEPPLQQPNEQPQQQLQQQQQKKQRSPQPPRAPTSCVSLLPAGGSVHVSSVGPVCYSGNSPDSQLQCCEVHLPDKGALTQVLTPESTASSRTANAARENSMPARVYFENVRYSAPASPTQSAMHGGHLTRSVVGHRRHVSPSRTRTVEQPGVTMPPSARTRGSVGPIL